MTKIFIINNAEYTIDTCTAIACTIGDTERQDALLVTTIADSGEKFENVVFGYEMPEDADEFDAICEDSAAWSSDHEDLASVIR